MQNEFLLQVRGVRGKAANEKFLGLLKMLHPRAAVLKSGRAVAKGIAFPLEAEKKVMRIMDKYEE